MQRQIPSDYPKRILKDPDEKYFDTLTGHNIAVKKLEYGKKLRFMAVSYDIMAEEVQVITIHPISGQEIKNKLAKKRWNEDEKR